MRLKRGGMALEAIREYAQLALKGGETKAVRKGIMMEAKEGLEARLMEMQESLDVINHKLDTYERKCDPVTMKTGKENS